MRFHTFRREQWISRPLDEVFAFFSNVRNLEETTPPWMRFRVLTSRSVSIAAGTKIRYRLRWHGFPLMWTTAITRWEPPLRFVDVQLRGPYRLWHHTHRLAPVAGGTLMTDVVRYRLPFGILGHLAYAIKVRSDLERIFDYRRKVVGELFAGTSAGAR